MRLYSLITILLLLSEVAMSKPFTYSETEHYEAPSVTTTLVFEQRLSALGFTPLDQSGLGKIPMLNMDQVFQKDEQVIFFKQGLKPSSKLGIQKIADGYVYHGKTETEVHYALFFDGFSKSEVSRILKRSNLSFNHPKKSMFSVKLSLFPAACASDVGSCETASPSVQSLTATTAYVNTANISSIAGSCAVSALQGAVSGAKDMAVGAWNFSKTLLTDPEKLWTATKKIFGEIQNLVANFQPRMKQFIESMRNLDPEIATEIICSTISSIIVQALIGGGIAKAAIVMTEKFLSLDKIRGALESLSRLKARGNTSSSAITSRMIACVR